MKKYLKILVCTALVGGICNVQVANAGYVTSDRAMATQKTVDQRAEILAMMDRDDVRSVLEEQGVSPEEAKARIGMLSASQVEELKTKLDTIPVGEGAVGAIVGAVLIVFFVLLFLDLIGETDAYDFDD